MPQLARTKTDENHDTARQVFDKFPDLLGFRALIAA